MSFHHVPVLIDEVVQALQPRDGARYVDCTVGGGGHTEALLRAADCRVLGIDQDPDALTATRTRCGFAAERIELVRGRFSTLPQVLESSGWPAVDGVLADLGVSSHQLDTPERGFSFRHQGPVDMRMDPSSTRSAAQLVDQASEAELSDLIWRYGEERRARAVARAIVAGRPWSDTAALASAVAGAVGRSKSRVHPATRTFQALRIATNEELRELERLLECVVGLLVPGGRVAIITFHSLEDRLVKQAFAEASGKGRPRDGFGNPVGPKHGRALKPVTPAEDDPNPRARSARLRVFERSP